MNEDYALTELDKLSTLPFRATDDIRRISLRKTEGSFHAWKGAEVPEELKTPLAKRGSGTEIFGVASGDRSATVKCGENYYKLKGCDPRPFEKGLGPFKRKVCSARYPLPFNEPRGSMTKYRARKELLGTELIKKRLEGYELLSPLEPAGTLEYKNVYFGLSPVHCAVMLTRGDTRLGDLSFRDAKEYSLTSKWMGFSEKLLRECRIKQEKEAICSTNFVIYPAGRDSSEGITRDSFKKCAIIPIDFEYASVGAHVLYPKFSKHMSFRHENAYHEGKESDSHPGFLDLSWALAK